MATKVIIPRSVTSADRSLNRGAVSVEYQTRSYNTAAGPNAAVGRDILYQFSRPYTFFFVASVSNSPGAFMVHFFPLGYPIVDQVNPLNTAIIPTGGDRWMPLIDHQVTAGNIPSEEVLSGPKWFRVKTPTSKIYVDWDHPNGGPQQITIGASNDIEAWDFSRF